MSLTTVVVESQVWVSRESSEGGGFSGTALGRRPQDPATEKGHRPKNRHSQKRKGEVPVSGFSPWSRVAGSPARSRRAPVCVFAFFLGRGPGASGPLLSWVPGFSLSFLTFPGDVPMTDHLRPLTASVTFQLPAGGTSGRAHGNRPKNRPFFRYPFTYIALGFLLASASFFPSQFALSILSYACVSAVMDYDRSGRPPSRCERVHRA